MHQVSRPVVLKIDLPANGVLSLIKPLNIQKGVYAPTEVLHGDFQVLRPGSGFKKAQAAISRDDFVGKFILTASRRLSPEEEVSVPTLAEWYIIPPEIKRICEHAKLTTDTHSRCGIFFYGDRQVPERPKEPKPLLPHFTFLTAALPVPQIQRYSTFRSDSSGCGRKTHPASAAVPVSFQEIQLDPSGAYQKLTGNYDEEISAEDTYQKLIDTILMKCTAIIRNTPPDRTSSMWIRL